MQTRLPEDLLATGRGRRADEILRSCVHCGMCNAVCPTYQLLGDELDGPRGRIYLIKGLLEATEADSSNVRTVRTHLDRCLTCRGCEVACPSGVQYGELLEIGREAMEEQNRRAPWDAAARKWLGGIAPKPELFARWMSLGRLFRWLLPRVLRKMLPRREGRVARIRRHLHASDADAWRKRGRAPFPRGVSPRTRGLKIPGPLEVRSSTPASPHGPHEQAGRRRDALATKPGDGGEPSDEPVPGADSRDSRRALLLEGCVQRVATPAANAAAERLLNANGFEVVYAEEEGCCGGLNLHLGQTGAALDVMRRNIDAMRPLLGEVEVIVSTASGCGVTVKDYGRLLGEDAGYAKDAARIAGMTRDLSEVAAPFTELASANGGRVRKVAWHAPCTLRHGQRVTGIVEKLLARAGFELVDVGDAHLCCGSAGTYSLLQPRLARRLRDDKLANLTAGRPDVIVTANVGCQTHLAAAPVPVLHWAELLAPTC